MMRTFQHIQLLFIATLLLAACSPEAPLMTPEEANRINDLTAQMTTRCIGRYLIDLPEQFVLNSEAAATIEGIEIKVEPMTKPSFDARFKAYRAKLGATLLPMTKLPFLRAVLPLHDQAIGGVFDRGESDANTFRAARTLELWAWKQGFMITGHIKAFDGTFPEDAEDSYVRNQGSDVPKKLAQLLRYYERVSGRAENEIPKSPGLCIANGFVAGPAIEDEGMAIAFELKGTPDAYFKFSELGDLHETTSLLQRGSQIEKEISPSGTVTLRKGALRIHDQPYEEWLMHGPTSEKVQGTMFTLHGNETASGPSKPFITWMLYNGFHPLVPPDLSLEEKERRGLFKSLEQASFSAAEAVALWDKVIPTLRPRPGAF